MAAWTIRRLEKKHDRSAFDSSQPLLDQWLKDRAGQFDRRDLSRTFVATRSDDNRVVGYYAISTHRVLFEKLPPDAAKGLPQLDVPVVLIGRLAVDREAQGQGLGAFLLVDALRRALQVSEQIGIRAVEVDALNESARNFYLKFGFRSLLDDPNHLFLPMHEIRKLKLPPL
ncbi:MAG: GNAT family N-acetyltransferase [Pirellulaceae bacterium]|nr:GNAT family N-acetyltransferase [Pirellulaceae bacterium]